MNRLGLHLHALRVARPRQLRARALRPLARRRFPPARGAKPFRPLATAEELWRSPAFAGADEVAGDDAGRILGLDVPFPPRDWTLPGEPRLRRFHLHYGEEVIGWARRGDAARARAALHAWIDANPPRPGDAWHPYPLSTRVGNWLAALSLEPELAEERVVDSIRRQLARLERNVEDDVLGNHVIRNARALVLGGSALDDARLLRRGVDLLRRELPEQVLPDGGHYERSPVYHLIVLRDLLEARAAAELDWLDEPIERMRRFAAALARPDGTPALFNDAPLDLAPDLDLPAAERGVVVFPDTGYAVHRDDRLWLAFDCGPPSPPFLPAHAHADALSFQLCWDGRPVVVDPGTPTYEPGAPRTFARATASHSTVSVDGGQFELWGAFRSGPLPRIRLRRADASELSGEVAARGVVHTRTLRLRGSALEVDDHVEGGGAHELRSTILLAAEAPARVSAVPAARSEFRTVHERLYEATEAVAHVVATRAELPWASAWRLELGAQPVEDP